MIIFTNSKGEIKDVDKTNDKSLQAFEINDDNENPFKDWSVAKICCYKATVLFGKVTMMTPYVDSRIIEHIEQLGKQTEVNAIDISANREGIMETFESTLSNEVELEDCRSAIMEIYEMLMEG